VKLQTVSRVFFRGSQLSVSSNGSTWVKPGILKHSEVPSVTFSILERIDVGETHLAEERRGGGRRLSVSSNGSTWVKLSLLG